MATNPLDAAIVAERCALFENAERAVRDLPLVEGIIHDRRATQSAEQGLSVENGLVGYHVLDMSALRRGGPVDKRGYEARGSQKRSRRVDRMFDDPELYDAYNLLATTPDNPLPVWSQYFEPTDDAPTLVRIERSAFVDTKAERKKSILLNTIGKYARFDCHDELRSGEHALSVEADNYIAAELAVWGLQMLRDKRGHARTSRPLRVWADLHNQRLYADIHEGRLPVFTDQQHNNMQAYLNKNTDEPDARDITPDISGTLLVHMINSPDVTRRSMSESRYQQIEQAFEAEAIDSDLLVKILFWAIRSGRATLQLGSSQGATREVRFANLKEPLLLDGAVDSTTVRKLFHEYVHHRPTRNKTKQAA